MRFPDTGRITPFPDSIIPGYIAVKSREVLNDDKSPAPFEFLTDASTFNSTEPCNLAAGKTLIVFPFICKLFSVDGLNQIRPSVSCFALTGSEKTISILWFSPGITETL